MTRKALRIFLSQNLKKTAICSSHTFYQCLRFKCVWAVEKNPATSMTRLNFLKKLGTELVKHTIKVRAIPPRTGIPASVQTAMEIVIGTTPQGIHAPVTDSCGTGKRNRCALYPRKKDTKFSVKCSLCLFSINIQVAMLLLVSTADLNFFSFHYVAFLKFVLLKMGAQLLSSICFLLIKV